jgi:hypothetical protein
LNAATESSLHSTSKSSLICLAQGEEITTLQVSETTVYVNYSQI